MGTRSASAAAIHHRPSYPHHTVSLLRLGSRTADRAALLPLSLSWTRSSFNSLAPRRSPRLPRLPPSSLIVVACRSLLLLLLLLQLLQLLLLLACVLSPSSLPLPLLLFPPSVNSPYANLSPLYPLNNLIHLTLPGHRACLHHHLLWWPVL